MESEITTNNSTEKENSFSPYYCVCEDSINLNNGGGDSEEILRQVTPFETGSLFEQKKAALKFIGERLLYIYKRDRVGDIDDAMPDFDFDTYTIKGYIVTSEGNFPMFYWSHDSSTSFKPWYLAEEFAAETEYLRKHKDR